MIVRAARTGLPARLGFGAAVLALLVTACAGGDDASSAGQPGSPDPTGTVELTVLAAASLTDVLPAIATDYEREHPGTEITFSFGSSASLAQQVISGAPADVLITASASTMAPVVDAGDTAAEPVVIARNKLEIAVPAGNPGQVAGLTDLGRDDISVALCAESVPCGAAADQVFATAGLSPSVVTREQDVRAVLTKVRLGEVDAGLVYQTDVTAAGEQVQGVPIPDDVNAHVDNTAAALNSPQQDTALDFVRFLGGQQAQQTLREAGFELP